MNEIFDLSKSIKAAWQSGHSVGYDAGYLAGVNAAKAIFDKHFPPTSTGGSTYAQTEDQMRKDIGL